MITRLAPVLAVVFRRRLIEITPNVHPSHRRRIPRKLVKILRG